MKRVREISYTRCLFQLYPGLKEEIEEYLNDGIKPYILSRYLGIGKNIIFYNFFPKKRLEIANTNNEWRKNNPVKNRKIARKATKIWYQRHPEKAREKRRKYRIKNKEKLKK